MRYNITLVAGSRPNGAVQFGSEAERVDADNAWEWLNTSFKNELLRGYKCFNAATLELSQEQAAELLKDYRVLELTEVQKVEAQKIMQSPAPWHLSNIAEQSKVYSYDTTGRGVLVAIFDTGVDTSHTDFEHRILEVFDAFNGIPLDSNHGTHVAGLVGSKTYGVAKQCIMLSLRVLLDAGGEDSNVVDGINWLLLERDPAIPMVANFSLGSVADLNSSFLENAVAALLTDGILVCAAAGNESILASLVTPARMANVITVGAVNNLNTLTNFSNYGPCIDILAPGSDIISLSLNETTATLSGTSMATPLVVGALARMLERQPDLTQTQAKVLLKDYRQATEAILPPDVDYTELNQSLPPESQLVNKVYSSTETQLLSSNIPGVIETAELTTLIGINPFTQTSIRPYVVIDGVKIYGEPVTLQQLEGPAVVVRDGLKVVKNFASIDLVPTFIPGVQPTMIAEVSTNNVRLLTLSIDPSNLTDYSLQLGLASGTFSYNTLGLAPQTKSIANIQGLTGVVERLKVVSAIGSAGTTVEGRLLPIYTTEQISLNLQPRLDFRSYTLADIVEAIASQAGTVVRVGLVGLLYESYQYVGRFIDALSTLAQEAGGKLVQQNGEWYIVGIMSTLGSFSLPVDDVISVDIEYQADVKDKIYSFIQTRKSLGQALIANLRTKANLLDPATLDSFIPKAVGHSLANASLYGYSSEASGTFASALTAGTEAIQQVGNLATTKSKLQPLKFEFGMKGGNFQAIGGNILVEAPPWSWQEWAVEDEASFKKCTLGGGATSWYQIRNVDTVHKKGLGIMDGFVDILIEVQLPSAGGILLAAGTLVNLAVGNGGWNGSLTHPSVIIPTQRTYEEVDADGLVTYKTKYYIPLSSELNSLGVTFDDKNLYSADLDLTYIAFNPQPYKIQGQLTRDNYLIDTNTSKGLGKLVSGTFYALDPTVLGAYDNIAKKIYSLTGSLIGIVDSQNNILDLSGKNLGGVAEQVLLDGPIFSSTSSVSNNNILDSLGNKVGDIITNSKTLLQLDTVEVDAIARLDNTILAYVNRVGQLVTKYNDKAIGSWTGAGVIDVVSVTNLVANVAGTLGSEVFGLPIGTQLGTMVKLRIKNVSNKALGSIRGNDVYSGTVKIGQVSFENEIILDQNGLAVASLQGNSLTSIGTAGYAPFNVSAGQSGGLIAYVSETPNGLYDLDGNFVASIAGETIRTGNGTPIGSVRSVNVIGDSSGRVANINGAGQIVSFSPAIIGQYVQGTSANFITLNGTTIGTVVASNKVYVASNARDDAELLNPLVDSTGTVLPSIPEYVPDVAVNDLVSPIATDLAFIPDSYTLDSRTAAELAAQAEVDSILRAANDALTIAKAGAAGRAALTANIYGKAKNENELLRNISEADRLIANQAVADSLIQLYGAGEVLDYLDQLNVLYHELDLIQNPLASTVVETSFQADQAKLYAEMQIQSKIADLEGVIINLIAALPVHEEVLNCNFLYGNILPLAANQLSITGAFGTYGAIENIIYSNGTVTTTARRLVI